MELHDDPRGALGPGDRFLKFEIRALIGRGGHARVYHGFDGFLGRDVAIKILHRQGGVTPDMFRRGQAEAQLLTRLRHPNIVEVIDAGVTEAGELYIVMELLRGRSLRDVLRQHRHLRIDEVMGILAAVADGVEAAHSEKAIHRDLKPENIFVTANNRPKVLDFGVAKMMSGSAWITQRDVILGTMLYMSPEQLQGLGVTPRTDVYALGIVAYECLLGRHPCLLQGSDMTVQELAWIQATRMPPLLSALDERIPNHVARVVNRAITKLPDQRFATMKELGAALRDAGARYAEEYSKRGSEIVARDLSIEKAGAGSSVEASGAEMHDTESQSSPGFSLDTPTAVAGARKSGPSKLPHQVTPAPVSAPVDEAPRSRRGRSSSRRAQVHRVVGAGVVFGSVLGGAWGLFYRQVPVDGSSSAVEPAPKAAPAVMQTRASVPAPVPMEPATPVVESERTEVVPPSAPSVVPPARASAPAVTKAAPRSAALRAVVPSALKVAPANDERVRAPEGEPEDEISAMPGSGLESRARVQQAKPHRTVPPAASSSAEPPKAWVR